jgi:hypothetical protein
MQHEVVYKIELAEVAEMLKLIVQVIAVFFYQLNVIKV